MRPRIVVMMSVYNEAQYLDETIPALIDQTMPDWRALLIDNGSTDASRAILTDYAHDDARISVTGWPTNLLPGVVANRAYAIVRERWPDCRWVLAHGADDLMDPDYLETVLAATTRHPNANLIFSPWSFIGGAKPDKRFPDYDPETVHAVHQLPAWHAVTRDLLDRVGAFNEDIIAADWDWLMRASLTGALVPYQLDRPYIALRVRDGARKTQSEEVHWPRLHAHLCRLANKPIPAWAKC